MKTSVYTYIGIFFKKVTGIKDISLMRKEIHKRIGQLFYHKKYTADDIVQKMQEMGMQQGSVVCIHASMKEFYNYQGTATELIDKITSVITQSGTLIMPAFPSPDKIHDPSYIFNPAQDKTAAGYLAETFRQYPGVLRSINVQHSVCAWGKHAKWLIKDHHKCDNCWGIDSPWYRMTTLNALVFCLGLPNSYIGTFDHCVEGILYKEHPYWEQFLNKIQQYRYYDQDGKIRSYSCRTVGIERRSREQRLIKYFNSKIYKKEKISNLQLKVFDSKPCLDIMTKLGRRGITMYYVPSSKGYHFDYNND